MNLPDHIHPIAVEEALLNIGMTTNEIRALTGNTDPQASRTHHVIHPGNMPDDVREQLDAFMDEKWTTGVLDALGKETNND